MKMSILIMPEKTCVKSLNFNRVSPGFFRTMEIASPQRTRLWRQENTLNSPAVAIVNEAFVRKVLQQGEPLGKIFRVDEGAGVPESPYQIIGVVKDTKYFNMREDFTPIAYLARAQDRKPDIDDIAHPAL